MTKCAAYIFLLLLICLPEYWIGTIRWDTLTESELRLVSAIVDAALLLAGLGLFACLTAVGMYAGDRAYVWMDERLNGIREGHHDA